MDKNMLKISLPDFKGPMTDLMTKLTGKESDLWWMAFKLFLRQQVTWYDHSDDLIKKCGLASLVHAIEMPRIFMVPAFDPSLCIRHYSIVPSKGEKYYISDIENAVGGFEFPQFVQVLLFIINNPTSRMTPEYYAITSESIFCYIKNVNDGIHLEIRSALQGECYFNGKPLVLLTR